MGLSDSYRICQLHHEAIGWPQVLSSDSFPCVGRASPAGTRARPVHPMPQRKVSLTPGRPPGGPEPLAHLTSPSRPRPRPRRALRGAHGPFAAGPLWHLLASHRHSLQQPRPRTCPGSRGLLPGGGLSPLLEALLGFSWVAGWVRGAAWPRAGDTQFLQCPGPASPAPGSPRPHPPLPQAGPFLCPCADRAWHGAGAEVCGFAAATL